MPEYLLRDGDPSVFYFRETPQWDWYCKLCNRYATESHIQSDGHQKKKLWSNAPCMISVVNLWIILVLLYELLPAAGCWWSLHCIAYGILILILCLFKTVLMPLERFVIFKTIIRHQKCILVWFSLWIPNLCLVGLSFLMIIFCHRFGIFKHAWIWIQVY